MLPLLLLLLLLALAPALSSPLGGVASPGRTPCLRPEEEKTFCWGGTSGEAVGGGRVLWRGGEPEAWCLFSAGKAGWRACVCGGLCAWDRGPPPFAAPNAAGEDAGRGTDGEPTEGAAFFPGGGGLGEAGRSWISPLAALLSRARAWEMESGDGGGRSSSGESDRQMVSGGEGAGGRADGTEAGEGFWTQTPSCDTGKDGKGSVVRNVNVRRVRISWTLDVKPM